MSSSSRDREHSRRGSEEVVDFEYDEPLVHTSVLRRPSGRHESGGPMRHSNSGSHSGEGVREYRRSGPASPPSGSHQLRREPPRTSRDPPSARSRSPPGYRREPEPKSTHAERNSRDYSPPRSSLHERAPYSQRPGEGRRPMRSPPRRPQNGGAPRSTFNREYASPPRSLRHSPRPRHESPSPPRQAKYEHRRASPRHEDYTRRSPSRLMGSPPRSNFNRSPPRVARHDSARESESFRDEPRAGHSSRRESKFDASPPPERHRKDDWAVNKRPYNPREGSERDSYVEKMSMRNGASPPRQSLHHRESSARSRPSDGENQGRRGYYDERNEPDSSQRLDPPMEHDRSNRSVYRQVERSRDEEGEIKQRKVRRIPAGQDLSLSARPTVDVSEDPSLLLEGLVGAGESRFFVARCNYYDIFVKTKRSKIWRAPEYVVDRIRKASSTTDNILLFFTVHQTSYFQGLSFG